MVTLELLPPSDEPYHSPGRRPKSADDLTRILRSLTPRMNRVLDWLAMGGVLSAHRLGLPGRALRHYQGLGLVERLPQPGLEELEKLFPCTDQRETSRRAYYCLGAAGEKITAPRHPCAPLTGYRLYTPARILHDLILNEVTFRLAELARAEGWRTFWAGTNAAEIRTGSEQLLEPDALLVLERAGERRALALEYHNEADKRQRAFDKVRRYEQARSRVEAWRSAWEVETFPAVLAIFRDTAVGLGYQEAVQEFNAQGRYYCKAIEAFSRPDGKLHEWLEVKARHKERIFA